MAHRPGFIRAHMYLSLGDDAERRFVNVAEWASRELLDEATASPTFRASTQKILDPRPGVYEVAVTLRPGDVPS
jgi:heme-degrading monooxygenase HmoA